MNHRYVLIAVLLTGSILLSSCKQAMPPQGNPVAADFSVSPPGDIVFNTTAGQTAVRPVTITNLTSNTIELTFFIKGGKYFSVRNSIQIPAHQTDSSVFVSFTPSATENDTAMLIIRSSGDSIVNRLLGNTGSAYTAIGIHYPSFQIVLTKILMNYSSVISGNSAHENINAFDTLSTGYDLFPNYPQNAGWYFFKFGAGDGPQGSNAIDPNTQIDKSRNIISVLSTYYGKFINLPFTYEPDSSIHCLLHGASAANHIQNISYQESEIVHDNGFSGPITTYDGSYSYRGCFDSSQIEITIPYKK